MADWNLPGLTDLYTNVLTYIKNRLNDGVMWLDSTLTAPTNLPTGAKRWNSTTYKFESWNGSAWVDMAVTYGISISGNAASSTNADTVDTFHASQTPGANQIPVLSASGDLKMGSLNAVLPRGNSLNVGGPDFYYALCGGTNNGYIVANAYIENETWKRAVTGTASIVHVDYAGNFTYHTAVAGAAGSTISWTDYNVWHEGNVIRGNVTAAGGVTVGTGFTITKGATGAYTINFATGFSAIPTIIPTIQASLSYKITAGVPYNGNSQIAINITDYSNVAQNADWNFIAIGPN